MNKDIVYTKVVHVRFPAQGWGTKIRIDLEGTDTTIPNSVRKKEIYLEPEEFIKRILQGESNEN